MAALVVLVGCGGGFGRGSAGGDPDGDGAEVVAYPSGHPPAPVPGQPHAASGTRTNPLPPGTTFKLGDWQVTLAVTDTDATTQVLQGNWIGELPAGRVAVLTQVELTYTGDASGVPWKDLEFAFVGSGGRSFGSRSADDGCGYLRDDLYDLGEMFPQANATGHVCVAVPADQLAGLWLVETTSTFEGQRVFVSVVA